MRAAACCTPVWLPLIASVKRALCWSQRPSLSTFKLSTPIAHICFGMCLSGELLISWARSRHSLNVRCKYSPASCRVCLINTAEDPPGRLQWCECDRRAFSGSCWERCVQGGSKVSWWEVDLDQKYVSASVGCQDGRLIYLITFV